MGQIRATVGNKVWVRHVTGGAPVHKHVELDLVPRFGESWHQIWLLVPAIASLEANVVGVVSVARCYMEGEGVGIVTLLHFLHPQSSLAKKQAVEWG